SPSATLSPYPTLFRSWILTAGGPDQPGRIWAGTLPGGLFRSDDRGETWTLDETLWNVPQREKWFGGGADLPGIHSVYVDPRDSTIGRASGRERRRVTA